MGRSHVQEIGLDHAEDLEILAKGRADNRVCVTLDHDFHAHLARSQAASPSVVFIRLEGLASEQQALLIQKVWKQAELILANGAAVTVDSHSIRIRALPLK
ncbi:MAG: DUF5615 family PIN-like protein [Acidobacteriota bacterium]